MRVPGAIWKHDAFEGGWVDRDLNGSYEMQRRLGLEDVDLGQWLGDLDKIGSWIW